MIIDHIADELRQCDALKADDVAALFDKVIELYVSNRLANVKIEEDGDMLLFQWGTYGQGRTRRFTVDLTRQTMLDLPDPNEAADTMQQLYSTSFYFCTAETDEIGSGEKWCATPYTVQEFVDFMKNSPAYHWAVSHQPVSLDVGLEAV